MQSNKLAMNNYIPNNEPNNNFNLESKFASFTFSICQHLKFNIHYLIFNII